ncbi:uncharacterized protein FIESC28_01478 [Fusarium coffeatum]|uniref:Heterokaryon incompatibility domain-containing protein n=1 Tax=Fusarium coffeatum TaxID=231269 RepID=A0A366SAT2_9HYPO|nr:uncharacterized protein FIESC28_01478 [Fusarium coffeatum]RBR25725.1 hypothetical protein FIESC28_01478 [Fusarium coffeatum]
MRLLNVNTLQLEWFPGDQKPAYAILSHTWGTEEIMLQDVPLGQFSATRFIDAARVDPDVVKAAAASLRTGSPYIGNSMRTSRWFTRGWTLQELLAPTELIFFASDWSMIGTRHEYAWIVSHVTGVEPKYLEIPDTVSLQARQVLISSATIAQRMHWASRRTTTRGEDMSYCLLGLFGINIPLLYGEGSERAFFRLQEAIVRDPTVFDVTLLAWDIAKPKEMSWEAEKLSYWTPAVRFLIRTSHPWYHLQPPKEDGDIRGLFARSVHSFSGSQDLVLVQSDVERSLTDRGLSITLPASSDSHPYLILPCRMRHDPWRLLAIPIVRQGLNMYARTSQEATFVEHDVWSRWAHRQVHLMARVKDLPFRPFETLLKVTKSEPAQLSLSIPSHHFDFVGIRTSTGWSRQHHPADTFLIPYRPRKTSLWFIPHNAFFTHQSFGWTGNGTFECVTAVLLQTWLKKTRFAVFLEAYETHWLLKPFLGPIGMSVCFRPDLTTFEEVDRVLQDGSRSDMSSWNTITLDDLLILTSSSSRFVTSLPTLRVGIEVSRSGGWMAWARSIYRVVELFAEFIINPSVPTWFYILLQWKGPTKADWDAMLPIMHDPYAPAAISMLFWFIALHQDMPLVAQLFPSSSNLIRQNRFWLAIIVDIISFKVTSSNSVHDAISAATAARLYLYYYKQPNSEITGYHAKLMGGFVFIFGWTAIITIQLKHSPRLLNFNEPILHFLSMVLLMVTHTASLCFYYFNFSR